jgi:hypothetical protein
MKSAKQRPKKRPRPSWTPGGRQWAAMKGGD